MASTEREPIMGSGVEPSAEGQRNSPWLGVRGVAP